MAIYDIGPVPGFYMQAAGYGVATPFGLTLPPGGKVAAFLTSDGAAAWDEPVITANCCTTLAQALSRVRTGKGDTIVVMPGHAENVADATMLDNLLPGTRILGLGWGDSMPKFTWTATGGQWTLDQKNVVVRGCKFDLAGIDAVTKGILVSAADNVIADCEFVTTKTAKGVAIGLEIATGGDRFVLTNTTWRSLSTVEPQAGGAPMKLAGTADEVKIINNAFLCGGRVTTAEKGQILVSGASTNLYVARNLFYNITASSTFCIVLADVASSGVVDGNTFIVLGDGGTAAAAKGVSFGASTTVQSGINYCSDEVKKSGMVAPAAAT